MDTNIIISIIIVLLFAVYAGCFYYLRRLVLIEEASLVSLFLLKTSKIPAIIEVMRPYVVDDKAFDSITSLHSEAMIHRYDSIYDLLEHNSRIEHEFLFLMKLSMQIPTLQKDKYFLYIRDFIILYERDMRKSFSKFNSAARLWNRFITLKNYSLIWLLLPGTKKETIS